MNKKILLGSIIAVIILVLVSFTGVVGYQTTSTIAKASPLFSVRSKRAIERDSKNIACEYVGKGEESFLSIPKRDDETELIQKFIDRVSKMDDNTFKRYLNLIINQIQKKEELKDVNIIEMITAIHQLKDNPDRIVLDNSDKNDPIYTFIPTKFMPTVCWFPGCFTILPLLLAFVVFFLLFILPCDGDTYDLCTFN